MNIGVDLGTTMTLLSRYHMSAARPIVNTGSAGYYSDVYYNRDNEKIYVGEQARELGVGKNTVNLRRKVKLALIDSEYLFFTGKNDKNTITISIKDVLIALLKNVKEQSFASLDNNTIDNVVATIPAGFGQKQTSIISKAVQDVFGKKPIMVEEPVAAAISYFENKINNCSSIIVFDLGGGTCDIALVKKIRDSGVKYMVVDRDMTRENNPNASPIGAERWDEVITEHVLNSLKKYYMSKYGAFSSEPVKTKPETVEVVRRQVVEAKHSFSRSDEPRRISATINDQICYYILKKETFENETRFLLNQVVDNLRDLYNKNKDTNSPQKIILVGGGSKMPQVKQAIEEAFADTNIGIELNEPEFAVVKGAAIVANDSKIVQRISPFSYGVRCKIKGTNKHMIGNIIKKDSPIPTTGERVFNTTSGRIRKIVFNLYENNVKEREFLDDPHDKRHKKIGDFELKIPNPFFKKKDVVVSLTLDKSNTLLIKATDNKNHIVIKQIELNNIRR